MIVCGKTWDRNNETWKWLLQVQEDGTQMMGVAGPLNFLPILRFIPKFKNTMKFLIDGKYRQHGLYKTLIAAQKKNLSLNDYESSNFIREFLLEKNSKSSEIQEKFYNDQQFHHLLGDLFGAGLDTTLTTIRWYFLYIAKHQKVQVKIKNEIKEVLQDRQPALRDIPYLPLVEASICEVQRIRSVVPVGIPHGTTTDTDIEGYFIPRGTMLVPLQWAIHMNEEVWSEPEKFDPGRFLDDNGQIKKNEYFMPFQVGKRMCVGDELARSLMFLFVVTTLQNFRISLEDQNVDLNGECGITLTPKHHRLIFSKE
ncbi:unnamed protein product [Acanthoscelides obtectus]|nr:unnamed protein product [Acanthoscelides obtectus]CAK1667062.1 Cytochrome P450 306a1 [Acanthoscelides obtectus]